MTDALSSRCSILHTKVRTNRTANDRKARSVKIGQSIDFKLVINWQGLDLEAVSYKVGK